MGITKYLNSITARMLLILIFAFLFIIAITYWVVESKGKPDVVAMSSTVVEEAGNEVINSILANISYIDGLALSTSAMSGGLNKDEETYTQVIGNLMQKTGSNISGGGVWFNPDMYKAGQDRQAFVWNRDDAGTMQMTQRYNLIEETPNPYYREWWFIPAMYSFHDHCVWSRAYIDSISGKSMTTCAKSLYNSRTRGFEGVVSFNLVLDDLNAMMQQWQQKITGYMFIVDLDNRFLTFPDTNLVTQSTALNPQGEMMTASQLAERHPNFTPIANQLNAINNGLIEKATDKNEGRYNLAAGSILSTTNVNEVTADEAKLLSALLIVNTDTNFDVVDTHLTNKIALKDDFILNEAATAFISTIPFTYWKLVIVKPNSDLVGVANAISHQLIQFMLIGFIPILLVTLLLFRNYFTRPLTEMATVVATIGDLIQQKKYQLLKNYKLPDSNVTEIDIISRQTNKLVQRVVDNEGVLAKINVLLEKKVEERTQALSHAIEDLKASQVQLVQSEKMASIGEMVAGVAHEVNTPLGYVRSNMELVNENLSRFDELIGKTEHLLSILQDPNADKQQRHAAIESTLNCCQALKEDEISEDLTHLIKDGLYGVDQISELVVSLRDFSRIDEAKIKNININDCVESSLTIARNNLKSIQVIKKLGELPNIECNPSQINQVLLNLFNNAAQAIPEGQKGKLLVSTQLTDDEKVLICITDNGTGINEDTLERIFEPFFTTKKAGEGTGLGLAISSKIIEQHSGTLKVRSIVGKGTKFIITLPIHQPTTQTQPTSRLLFDS